jgi:hypothetical protein
VANPVKVFTFPYSEEKLPDGTIVSRPLVFIHLQGQDGGWQLFDLYPDAGADITLLREHDCRLLGYELEAGKELFIGGICSGPIRTFVHELPLRLGTGIFICPVAFAEKANVPRLLGRAGLFYHFKVCYDDARGVTQFILQE